MSTVRHALLCVIQALDAIDDPAEEQAAVALHDQISLFMLHSGITDQRQGRTGRVWSYVRNDSSWFDRYALQPSFIASGSWKAPFRVSKTVFETLRQTLEPLITKETTNFRIPLPPKIRIASYLMYCGGASSDAVGSQLGLGPSTVSTIVKQLSRIISSSFSDLLQLPKTEQQIAKVMSGFESIRGLPYCVGAIDGTHITWSSCPEEQYYEYRCYKGFTSVVVFAVVSSDRRILYADIGRLDVLGDSSIFNACSLKTKIDDGEWPGSIIPDLQIGDICVKPYLIGDCAFTLDVHMMKSSSKAEMRANPVLKSWDSIASQTRKPVECAFGMLKNRFPVLKDGVRLHHEDDVSSLALSCLLVHNLCIHDGDPQDFYLPQDEDDVHEVVSVETSTGKKQRDALLYYVFEKLGA